MNAPRIVVMGVSGCGKTTVGRLLASALGVHYVEGDELHSPQNIERMGAGVALTDADRLGWLQQVAQQLANATAQACGVVVACSALKRGYRDLLRNAAPDLRFVHLSGERDLLERRLASRQGHYMPSALLQSQLDTLEGPADEENAITIDIDAEPARLVAQLVQRLQEKTR